MAERTDFSKDTVKGKPTTVRFVEKHLDLVKQSEGLNTPQQVIDFLLNKYWFENKFGSNPILDRNNQFQNAARGRDESGINEDEVKDEKKKDKSQAPDPKDKAAYLKWLRNQ